MDTILPGVAAVPNIHPLFVHFPIALWLTALLLWGLGMLRKRDDLFAAGRWLLYLGTASAAVAAVTGYLASESMGHDTPGHELVHVHRDFMLVTTGLATVTTALAFVWRRSRARAARWTLLALLAATAVVLTLGADRGAELVYRYGVGTAGEPPPAADGHDHDHGTEEQDPADGHDHDHGTEQQDPADGHDHDHGAQGSAEPSFGLPADAGPSGSPPAHEAGEAAGVEPEPGGLAHDHGDHAH